MPTEDTEKQLGIFHRFGHQLIEQGIQFIKKAYKLSPKVFTRTEVLNFLSQETGIPTSSISLADEKYYVESWAKWEKILDYDLVDKQQYLSDRFDCDNFSFAYSALATLNYNLNSCGVGFGNIYDSDTKTYMFRHAFNLIITHDNGVLKLNLYEPQTDEFALWQKGNNNILPILGWEYRPDWLLYW